jgi:uncharacterized protein (TIGR03437 family)
MNNLSGAIVSSLLACIALCGQSQHTVQICGLPLANNVVNCYLQDSSTIGGVRYEDYKVTNPLAVQFDPAQRLKELAALGTSNTDTMCEAPPIITSPAPTITFDKTNVVAQIYWVTPVASFSPSEFMDVQFSSFTASNGYTSQTFGFRMVRQVDANGNEIPQFNIQVQAGNPGLENVPGLAAGTGVGFGVDPVGMTASVIGVVPSQELLREAILGVFVNAQSILNAAKFTVTNPPPAGKPLWTSSELISLAGQAQPWIASAAAASTTVPLGPPFSCVATLNGYTTCNGEAQISAFSNMLLTWGGEYLSLHTQQSFNVLVSNLRSWATANAPALDPTYGATSAGATAFFDAKMSLTTPLVMLWPTLRADPMLAAPDRESIDNWIGNSLVPSVPGADFFSNDLGYWADEIVMADAIRRSDDVLFAFGVQRFYGALNQMRTDGSFPLAATLSACSATYSNADFLHLIAIAEMAATQGYDLYRLSVNGRSLETAIEFLLNAYQNPALLYQYSMAGGGACFEGNPGDPPDFSVFSSPSNGLTWVEAYLARFPLSATAGRLRTILGSNLSAPPFPLMVDRTGLNATCAFRKSFEFQPVSGPKIAILSGDGQTGSPNQPLPAPLVVRVTDSSGKALVGELASFAVTGGSANLAAPAQVLADSTGSASATVTMGPGGGPANVTATALGVAVGFSITIPPGLAIYAGGIGGIGGSVPTVTTISPGALFSIYGQGFVPDGTGRRVNPDEIVNGVLPTTLLGVCVNVNGSSAPLLDVYPGLINAVAPAVPSGTNVPVTVTTGCGTPNAVQSLPQLTTVAALSPEFLYFVNNANGENPVAAVNLTTGDYVGPATLGSGFAPAKPGDVVAIFASGFGDTNPHIAPGAVASSQAPVTSTTTVTLGSIPLDANNVLYVGAAPGEPISQVNIRIPSGTAAGNQALQIRLGNIASPPGAYLAIAAP